MRRLVSKAEAALETAAVMERTLLPGETSVMHATRTTRRRLSIGQDGPPRLRVQDGQFDGYLRLANSNREIYVRLPEASASEVARILPACRAQLHLGHPPAPDGHRMQPRAPESFGERIDLAQVAEDPGPVNAGLAGGMGTDCFLQAIDVTEVLSESVFADSVGTRAVSTCWGVELHAVAAAADGSVAASLTRYASTLDRLDAASLGRELRLTTAALCPGTEPFGGREAHFTPSATALLLQAVMASLLLNPLTDCPALGVAVIDDGQARDGWRACAFDCEGTPTRSMELVTRDGVQRGIATRLMAVPGTREEPGFGLTGHARWDPVRNLPLPAPSNVRLEPDHRPGRDLGGERCVVADVRSLGVEEYRSGGSLAFRLLAVRVVDGIPVAAYTPIVVEGGAADFLAAITGGTADASFSSVTSGAFSITGAEIAIDLFRLRAKREA
jgi:hypothetical protein